MRKTKRTYDFVSKVKKRIEAESKKVDAYYSRYGLVPKEWRNTERFSIIMLNAARVSAKNYEEFISFLVSSKREINAFIRSGKLPKRVEKLLD